ncbi:hypothetical protein LguiA_034589 [Lonicera macranthoides]
MAGLVSIRMNLDFNSDLNSFGINFTGYHVMMFRSSLDSFTIALEAFSEPLSH